jgi:hypothetical protein
MSLEYLIIGIVLICVVAGFVLGVFWSGRKDV